VANAETPAAPSDTAPLVVGSYITRIRLALAQPGATLMLVGPTGTGKSFQTIQAATELHVGLEMVTFDPGLDAQEPIGGYAPRRIASDDPGIDSWLDLWPCGTNGSTPAMGDALRAQTRVQYLALHQQASTRSQWEAIDGPITRWARRAIAGEDVLLFLDELARGHPGVVSMVMGILNRHSAAAIARMGLTTPDDGAAGTYHLVNAWHTRERLVVPATRIRIVAAANLGDRYQGADLSDPAFRRRWDAWLHLSRYDDDTQRTILAATLDLPARDRLLTALLQVATAVVAYEHANVTLISTLDLPTLITWGQTVQARAGRVPHTEAFTTAARDIWIDRLCPLAGDELDGTVRSDLARLVEEVANTLT
jgi:MoxR-like ATPase